ncbi:regulator of sigma E protease, partial [Trypanosoma cruzi]
HWSFRNFACNGRFCMRFFVRRRCCTWFFFIRFFCRRQRRSNHRLFYFLLLLVSFIILQRTRNDKTAAVGGNGAHLAVPRALDLSFLLKTIQRHLDFSAIGAITPHVSAAEVLHLHCAPITQHLRAHSLTLLWPSPSFVSSNSASRHHEPLLASDQGR